MTDSPETDLDKLREWVRPLIGEVEDDYLRHLHEVLESAAKKSGRIPQYRQAYDA